MTIDSFGMLASAAVRILPLLFFVAATACSSTKHHDDLGDDLDMSVDAAVQTFTWSGTIQAASTLDGGVVPDAGLVGLDATIAVLGTPYSESETGGGGFTLMLPIPAVGGQIAYAASVLSPGYLGQTIFAGVQSKSTNGFLVTGGPQTDGAILLSDEQASAFLGAGGLAYPATTTGYVSVVLVNANHVQQGISGATATISTTSATTVYANAAGQLDAALTSTSTAGRIVFGAVTAGAFTVTINAPSMTCTPVYDFFFPNTGNNTVGGQVAATTITNDIVFNCQ